MKIDRSKQREAKRRYRARFDKENMRDPIGNMIRAIDKIEGDAISYVHRLKRKGKIALERGKSW